MGKFVLIAAAAFAMAGSSTAMADANAQFCAKLYTTGGIIDRCDYYTFQQCQATIQGLGGTCFENPYYRRSVTSAPARNRYR